MPKRAWPPIWYYEHLRLLLMADWYNFQRRLHTQRQLQVSERLGRNETPQRF